MADTFDAVLAEMRERANAYPAGVCMDLRVFANRLRDAHHAAIAHGKRANQAAREELDRLAAAHAAEVAERDARIAYRDNIIAGHAADTREYQKQIQQSEARAEAAERDARRYRWLRDRIAPEELTDEVVALFAIRTVGPIANRPADDDCLDDVDAAIDAAIATPERAGRE